MWLRIRPHRVLCLKGSKLLFFILLLLFFVSWSACQYHRTEAIQGDTPIEHIFVALLPNGDSLLEYSINVNNPYYDSNISLLGRTIENISVLGYDNSVLTHKLQQNVVEISPAASNFNNSGIRIIYSTPDLTYKKERIWSTTFRSPAEFSIKMPLDSHIIKWGQVPPLSIKKVGEQDLLTFSPGNVSLDYIIGPLGTSGQANAVISSAESTIFTYKNRYNAVNLAQPEALLKEAMTARQNGDYLQAEKYGEQANDAIVKKGQEFVTSKDTIDRAAMILKNITIQGDDLQYLLKLLDEANHQFSSGNYTEASNIAEQVIISSKNSKSQSFTSNPFLIPIVILVIAAVILLLLRKSGNLRFTRNQPEPEEVQYTPKSSEPKAIDKSPFKDQNYRRVMSTDLDDVKADSSSPSLAQLPSDQAVGVELSSNQRSKSAYVDPQILERVASIAEKKPHLRQEDKELLQFLFEKQGAVFEKELRNRFIMPKTSLWRMVRRLEREELVEILKIGNQNLIKLRVEIAS